MRRFLKYLYHHIFCPVLLLLGVDTFFRSRSGYKRLIIMYHGIRDTNQQINGRTVSVGEFEKHIQYFIKHYEIVSLEDLCKMKETNVIPSRHTIAFTFDDGLLNNFSVALPILEKYNVPATFFICSASLEHEDYFHPSDLIDIINVGNVNGQFQVGAMIFDTPRSAYQYMNALTFDQWKIFCKELYAACVQSKRFQTVHDEHYQLARRREFQHLSTLLSFGSHSRHHVNVTTLTAEELQDELGNSKTTLERYAAVNALAFPYGYYNADVVKEAQRQGYRFLIAAGDVQIEFKDDVFPRIGVLDNVSVSYAMLSIAKGFKRFGF